MNEVFSENEIYGFIGDYIHMSIKYNTSIRLSSSSNRLKEAYDKLGMKKVKELKYNQKEIRKALVACKKASQRDKIIGLLEEYGYHTGGKKTVAEVKKDLKEIYKLLEINGSPKATDLAQWFDVKEEDSKINGKTTRCYTIIRQRIL